MHIVPSSNKRNSMIVGKSISKLNRIILDSQCSILSPIYPIRIESSAYSSSPKGHKKKVPRSPKDEGKKEKNPLSPYIHRLVLRIPKIHAFFLKEDDTYRLSDSAVEDIQRDLLFGKYELSPLRVILKNPNRDLE